jgi:hypothetical protein
VATSTSAQSTVVHTVPIVVLGTDAVLAAQPGTAVQLAHACLKAGFANVIPASWGDELIASATLRKLGESQPGPSIACSCPIVAHRLLSASADLRPVLLPFVPPPVAVSRYVHLLARPNRARITYVGNCPGAIDDSIDIRMSPDALISMLAERRIVIEEQPRVFESVIPADRRRFRSQVGGLPSAEMLWAAGGSRRIVEVSNGDLVSTIAQHIIANENVLIDAAVALGCVCSGAFASGGRHGVVAIEPPRASSAVIDEAAPIELELRVPAASRTPVDVMAISPLSTPPHPGLPVSRPSTDNPQIVAPLLGGSWETPRRHTPPGGLNASDVSAAARQQDSRDRRALPRAYIVRRRPSPRGTPVVPSDNPPRPLTQETKGAEAESPAADDRDSPKTHTARDASEDEEGEQEAERVVAESLTVSPVDSVEAEPQTLTQAEAEPQPTPDLLPPPAPAVEAHPTRHALEFSPPPLRVVENTPTREPLDAPRPLDSGTDQLRLLSATRTAVRDLRDAFMVTVSRPGETVTRSQPPEGVTGSIMGEQMTIVRLRNVILVILAFVALIVVLALPVLVFIDRRLNPPPASSAPANPN